MSQKTYDVAKVLYYTLPTIPYRTLNLPYHYFTLYPTATLGGVKAK